MQFLESIVKARGWGGCATKDDLGFDFGRFPGFGFSFGLTPGSDLCHNHSMTQTGTTEGAATMTDQAIVIDTPEGISTWVFLSRMHQLALELNTGMHHSRGPILHSMYREGLIDTDLRGTKKNKQMVLQAMVDFCNQNLTDWSPSNSVKKALAR